VDRTGEKLNAYTVLIEKTVGKCPLTRPRIRCKNDIKWNLREMGCENDRCVKQISIVANDEYFRTSNIEILFLLSQC